MKTVTKEILSPTPETWEGAEKWVLLRALMPEKFSKQGMHNQSQDNSRGNLDAEVKSAFPKTMFI